MWLRRSAKAAYVTEEQTNDSCLRDMFSLSKNKQITNLFDNYTLWQNISIAFCYLKAPTQRCWMY